MGGPSPAWLEQWWGCSGSEGALEEAEMALRRVTDRGTRVLQDKQTLARRGVGGGGLLVEDTSWINAPRQEEAMT